MSCTSSTSGSTATVAVDVLSYLDISGSTILADKAYGTNEILDYIQQQDGDYAIPPKSNTRNPWRCDWALYKERHFVEINLLLPLFRNTLGTLSPSRFPHELVACPVHPVQQPLQYFEPNVLFHSSVFLLFWRIYYNCRRPRGNSPGPSLLSKGSMPE